MEKDKILRLFQIVALVVLLLAEILLSVIVLTINMLPVEYVTALIVVLSVVALGMALFMFVKVKSNIAQWRRITSAILALVISCGCLVVTKLGWDAYSFVSNVSGSNNSDAQSTYVLVLNDNPATSIEDTKNYKYGAIEDYDVEHTQKMLDMINEKTDNTIQLTYYKQASVMVDALYAGEIDAFIMNGASISLLIENETYIDLLSHVRMLYTLSFENEKVEETKKDVTNSPFVFYISGSDTRSKKLVVSRSDVNILAVVNPNTKQILLVNTPRDYYIPNPAGNGKLDKLTHCGNYGVECSAEALSSLYEVDVDCYAKINFTGFEALIDAIGGVTIYSDSSFKTDEGYIQKGENQLNGKQALAFARERYNVSGGDNGRGQNQMKVVKAVVDKLSGSSALITAYADILKSLEGMLDTNLTSEQISALVKMQLKDMSPWNVQSFAVTGKGSYGETYSAPGEQLYVMHPNETTVEQAKELINKVMNDEMLTAEDLVLWKAES